MSSIRATSPGYDAPFDRQPEPRGPFLETHYPHYEDWNKHLADDLKIKNSNNEWKHSFQKMTYSLRSWFPYFSSKEALQQPPPQPPVKLRPPPEAKRKFKSVLISHHFRAEITRYLAESIHNWETVNPTEWYMELRHFFIDLPTQLRELEEHLTGTSSMSSINDNEENQADTRALANWTSYQLPPGFAGPTSVSVYPHRRYPNLRHSRRIVFSQRLNIKDNHNSGWLAGRWLVVAYLFAATPEAVQDLDVKSILLSSCTPGRGNINTMSSLNAYNAVNPPLSISSGSPEWWLLPTRDIFFQLQRRYDLMTMAEANTTDEMLATAFISHYPDVYHKPFAYGYDYDSSDADYKRRLRDMEGRLRDMEGRLRDMERPRPLPFVRARHGHGHGVGGGILPELNDRCQWIDRMWPVLMTGQDIKKQTEGVKTAGTPCGDTYGASSTTSSISSICRTPSTSSASSQDGYSTTTFDDDDEGT